MPLSLPEQTIVAFMFCKYGDKVFSFTSKHYTCPCLFPPIDNLLLYCAYSNAYIWDACANLSTRTIPITADSRCDKHFIWLKVFFYGIVTCVMRFLSFTVCSPGNFLSECSRLQLIAVQTLFSNWCHPTCTTWHITANPLSKKKNDIDIEL